MAKTVKVKITEIIEVDVAAWANEYGVDPKDVKADVAAYFRSWCSEQLTCIGMAAKQ